ncbi:cell division protein ZipA [Litoribrevibacter euphylliae]|uniref:Cell division protein ZipA n=1 Tax=Litoribrevibacter euphylliae TaxID=1834034 RepID=A0ABV7HDL3_9GAMM
MDISLREWLILVGLLVVAAILVHGYLHMRRHKLDTTSEFSNIPHSDDCNGELPNGGARIRNGEERNEPTFDQDFVDVSDSHDRQDTVVPVLMDSVSVSEEPLDRSSQGSLDFSSNELDDSDSDEVQPTLNSEQQISTDSQDKPEPVGLSEISEQSEDVLMRSPESYTAAPEEPVMSVRRQQLEKCRLAEDHLGPTEDPDRVFMLHVAAKDEEQGFNCGRLVDVAMACGLRHGKMDIFHRHQEDNGQGKVQFSMVSSVNPGSFDLDKVDDQWTPGVTFFMSLPGPTNNIQAFDYMYEMAKVIAKNMNGEVRDEQHSVMTTQTAEHIRQEILDYERKRRLSQNAG